MGRVRRRRNLQWEDVRLGDMYSLQNGETYLVVGTSEFNNPPHFFIVVDVLLSNGGREEWSGRPYDPYFQDVLVSRLT